MYNDINALDRKFGAFMGTVDRNFGGGTAPFPGSTVTLFVSDHGSLGKYTNYDAGLRAVTFLRLRGFGQGFGAAGTPATAAARSPAGGSRVRLPHLVSFVDIAPTLVLLASGKQLAADEFDGRSFVAILKNAALPVHQIHKYTYGLHTSRGTMCVEAPSPKRSVTDGRWKLIRNYNHEFAHQSIVMFLHLRQWPLARCVLLAASSNISSTNATNATNVVWGADPLNATNATASYLKASNVSQALWESTGMRLHVRKNDTGSECSASGAAFVAVATPLVPLRDRVIAWNWYADAGTCADACRAHANCTAFKHGGGDPSGASRWAQIMRTQCRPSEELYDLEADPHEQNNLASDRLHRVQLRRLARALAGWMDQQNDTDPVKLSESVESRHSIAAHGPTADTDAPEPRCNTRDRCNAPMQLAAAPWFDQTAREAVSPWPAAGQPAPLRPPCSCTRRRRGARAADPHACVTAPSN